VMERAQPERFPGNRGSGVELGELGRLGIEAEAALVVPLSFRDGVMGVLVAVDRGDDGSRFGTKDEEILRAFAGGAGIAVAIAKNAEHDRLRHSLEAAERERRWWARELHDETLQALGGLRMLHVAALRGRSRAEGLRQAVEQGVELIEDAIANLSSLIAELRPAALDQIGLSPALRSLAKRRSQVSGVQIDVLVRLGGDGGRLPADLENTIYRLVQEGLNNVAKHARATRVEAVVEYEGGVVRVELWDDGCGFDPKKVGRGFGLIGMRERVELVGGSLTVDSRPGRGTTVKAMIPAELKAARSGGTHVSSRPLSST
jgi:signal transduction histidine kinase